MESKGQKLEAGTAGTMSSGGAGFQDRSSVSSERQVRPRRGSQGRFWTGEEAAWRCRQSWRRQGRAAGNQLEDCSFGPMKLLLITHSHMPCPSPCPRPLGPVPRGSGGKELWEGGGQSHPPRPHLGVRCPSYALALRKHFCLPAVVHLDLETRPR